jgi:hypothetical protein
MKITEIIDYNINNIRNTVNLLYLETKSTKVK